MSVWRGAGLAGPPHPYLSRHEDTKAPQRVTIVFGLVLTGWGMSSVAPRKPVTSVAGR